MTTRFEWDRRKADGDLGKHGISFETAQRAFADPFALSIQDRAEEGELRWITLGGVDDVLLLLVAHTLREEDEDGTETEIIRIISARRATGAERRRYEGEPR